MDYGVRRVVRRRRVEDRAVALRCCQDRHHSNRRELLSSASWTWLPTDQQLRNRTPCLQSAFRGKASDESWQPEKELKQLYEFFVCLHQWAIRTVCKYCVWLNVSLSPQLCPTDYKLCLQSTDYVHGAQVASQETYINWHQRCASLVEQDRLHDTNTAEKASVTLTQQQIDQVEYLTQSGSAHKIWAGTDTSTDGVCDTKTSTRY